MAKPVSGVNPEVLVWARESSGRTVEEVAAALKKDPDVIRGWERGPEAPTYVQLETLAYRVYKRPIAIFFFPEPPEEPDPENSFRTLPAFEIAELSADTRFMIRDARALKLSLEELNQGVNPAPRKVFRDLRADPSAPVAELASKVRGFLGVDLQTQKKLWGNTDEALKAWREAVEEAGVFVFKNSFQQRDVSGFCLSDHEFPIIYLNNGTARSRQIFTLFHELAHLLIQTNGVTKVDDRYIRRLSGEEKQIEIFCNRFAAELLVPHSDFRQELRGLAVDDESIAEIAQKYKVSREVVLRKMCDMDLVSSDTYDQKAAQWSAEYERSRGRSGGNYYATQAAYLGEKYMRLAFRRYYEGIITLQQLAHHLKVRPASVPGLEQALLQQAA